MLMMSYDDLIKFNVIFFLLTRDNPSPLTMNNVNNNPSHAGNGSVGGSQYDFLNYAGR